MPTHRKVYARSIVRRQKQEVTESPSQVLFLSPYLTSRTAESVICEADSDTSEIYTTFSAANFAAGGSSLTTVRHLIDAGFDVYHLPDLHAKVVLTEHFASVGSQNLTAGGTRNREASVAISDATELAYLRSQIMNWLGGRVRVTSEMVDDMEARLPTLKNTQQEFRKAVDTADEQILLQEADRQEEQRLRDEERKSSAHDGESARRLQAQLRRRSRPLREALRSREVRTSTRIRARLVIKELPWSTYSTLERRRQDVSLLEWRIGDHPHRLTRRKRLLLLLLDNGRLAWPALNKTQLTQFGTQLWPSNPGRKQIIGHKYSFEYDLATHERELQHWNVQATIKPYVGHRSCPGVVVRGYFSLDDVTIVDLDYQDGASRALPAVAELHSHIEAGGSEIREEIRRQLLTPFRYTNNSHGITADEFFAGQGESYSLRLNERDGYRFLTAEAV